MKRITIVMLLLMGVFLITCQKDNKPPVIFTITAQPDSVTPGQGTTLTVEAEDPDNDELTYTWSAASGTLSSATGSSVIWTAPTSTGSYSITVKAEDPGELSDEASKTIKVYQSTVYGYTEGVVYPGLPIYDSTWTYSTIGLSGAPTNAVIDSIQIATNITHAYPSDLLISLEGPDFSVVTLWDNTYPGGIVGITTTYFNGKGVNGNWTLWIDEYLIDEGTLNSWGIGIFWHY
jgi:subtilisin-like proprotein convertase family protein